MAMRKERTFGQVIRERRRQLDLTQQEARRIRTSTPYIGHQSFSHEGHTAHEPAHAAPAIDDVSGFRNCRLVT